MGIAMRENLDRHFGFLVSDVARLLHRRFDARARRVGLTRAQCAVLARLAQHEGIHQGALADLLEMQPITLGRLIDRMEACGLVERRPHPTDRRVRLLHLTAKSQALLETIWRLGAETIEEALEGLPEAERERLIDALLAVKDNFARADGTLERSAGNG
jgi:DNA-binding MarR family transcriptional regulator